MRAGSGRGISNLVRNWGENVALFGRVIGYTVVKVRDGGGLGAFVWVDGEGDMLPNLGAYDKIMFLNLATRRQR